MPSYIPIRKYRLYICIAMIALLLILRKTQGQKQLLELQEGKQKRRSRHLCFEEHWFKLHLQTVMEKYAHAGSSWCARWFQ
eukprot:5560332-Amphidinium_carterae.1